MAVIDTFLNKLQRLINVADSVKTNKAINRNASLEIENVLYANGITGEVSYDDLLTLKKSDVRTIVTGIAASMASIILANGSKGKRCSLKNSEVMIHQPLIGGGLSGQQTDITIHANYLEKTREKLERIMADNCGKTYEQLHKDCERDNYLSAEEACAYGLVDKVIAKR